MGTWANDMRMAERRKKNHGAGSQNSRHCQLLLPLVGHGVAARMGGLQLHSWVALDEQVGQITKLDQSGKCAVSIVHGPTK